MAKTKKKTKKKASAGLAGRYSSQVDAESTLRFNPERSTISQQIQDAASTRDTTIRAARGSAAGIKRAAEVAEPGIRKAYGEAGALLKGAVEQTDPALAKLGPVADGIKAGIARDRERATGRLGESLAAATTELKQRSFDAEAGRVNAEGSARDQFAGAAGKLGERLRNVAVEEGAFRQGRAGELGEKDAERDFTASQNAANRETQRDVAGVDASGKIIPGGPKDKSKTGGPKKPPKNRLSNDKHADTRAKIGRIAPIAKRAVERGKSYDQIVQLVASGIPASSETKGAVSTKKMDALRKEHPDMSESEARRRATGAGAPGSASVPGVGEEAVARAVVDQQRDGYVSRKTAEQLHAAGYTVEGLGLTPYTKSAPGAPGKLRAKKAKARGRVRRPSNAPSTTLHSKGDATIHNAPQKARPT